ncbi:hypothetical protein Tfer_3194 [Thermincola ferriacetica]|uniref:YkuS family protein n=2 Tax=Thermincola TaxID=278993 RepID=D5XBK2_THEPJ|nr:MULTISPECIES: YkuS family protein [Thermincola]ADG83431.1 protein of unknown function UPF0180 [Thermincola potens JR]KNZ68268.1 hypothetical protein Tfer_3194 [Thermincola ferriacetica]
MKRVAVEGTLGNISEYLSTQGYEIVSLDPHTQTGAELKNCDAIIVSGQDNNLMGMNTVLTDSPVINARGMSPEQVHDELKRRIGQVRY